MEENNISSTGILKDDIEAIKSTLASLDKNDAKILRDKFRLAGVKLNAEYKTNQRNDSFAYYDQLALINKQFLASEQGE